MYREVQVQRSERRVCDDVLAAATARFESKLDELATRSSDRQRQEIDGLAGLGLPVLWEANRRFVRDSRELLAAHLLNDCELPEACPGPDREAARLAAQGGLGIADTLKSFRIAHACTMDAWHEAIGELDLPSAERADCVEIVSRFITDYENLVADLVTAEHERECERLRTSGKGRRLELLRDLLAGHPEGAAEFGYALTLHHVGIVASGPNAERTLTGLARSIGHQHLVVSTHDGLATGWLGARRGGAGPKRLLRDLKPPTGVTVAVGNLRSGYDGLRRTHREASGAHLVALRRPESIVFYDDVTIEVLALRDEAAARAFIEDVLGNLEGDDDHSQRLRTTLIEYFRAEQNAVSAASALRVNARTVRRHLDEVEARIGHRVNRRRADLEAALRLRSLLAREAKSLGAG